MDVIKIARELGAAIQQEEAYKKYHEARLANEKDDELNDKIGEFNLARISLTNEIQKPEEEKSQSKIETLNNQLQELTPKLCPTKICKNSTQQNKKWICSPTKSPALLLCALKAKTPKLVIPFRHHAQVVATAAAAATN